MADTLYPTDVQEEMLAYDENDTVEYEDTSIEFKESVYFDGDDFHRDSLNRIVGADGIDAFEQWCRVCLATDKNSLFCYPDGFGINYNRIIRAQSKTEAQAIITSEIKTALMGDSAKRTKQVKSIDFNWLDSDSVEVTITVVGIDDVTRDIFTTIDTRM